MQPGPVSHVIMPFLGSDIGGSHVAAFTLADALHRHHQITCVVICPSPSAIADEARRREFLTIASGDRPTYRHSLAYDVRRLAHRTACISPYRSRAAVIHCNDIQALKSWGPVARILGIPLIYHHRSLNSMTFLKRRVMSLADYAICVSRACFNNLACLDRRKLVIDPVGVPDDLDRIAAREALIEEFGIARHAQLVGFAANFFARKRPFFFLDVCAHLAAHVPAFHGVIFGAAREIDEPSLRAYAERIGIADRLTVAGFRLPPARNIAALDLLLVPALDEPLGLTLLEAVLVGTPYVASASAGHIETYQCWNGGRLVSKHAEPAEFASVAADLLRDPSRASLGSAERARAREVLSPRRHADEVARVYRAAMAGTPPAVSGLDAVPS
jgi:glycosyltransferase involved in cell wall biosynthesis